MVTTSAVKFYRLHCTYCHAENVSKLLVPPTGTCDLCSQTELSLKQEVAQYERSLTCQDHEYYHVCLGNMQSIFVEFCGEMSVFAWVF